MLGIERVGADRQEVARRVVQKPAAPAASIHWWWRLPLLSLLSLRFVLGAAPWLPALLRRRRKVFPALL